VPEQSYITGYYGCNCHPFESWTVCKRFHKQKLKIGEPVRHRCTGQLGTISKVESSEGNWYLVKFGTKGVPSDHELEHAASLIKMEENAGNN
jgi:hypothetical protein